MINLTVVIDNEEAIRKFRELQKTAKTVTSSVITDADRMDIAMRRIAMTLGKIGVGASLTGLIRQIALTRGEFQQLEVAFTTLLQSKEKADRLMAEMVQLAAKTPFDLQGVASGARQLLAYGFASEEITDTLTRLGNVAAGLGLPLERLTYLYGTTAVQGRLYARDMLQFTSSGIPVLQELANMYGKTTEEINAMVSAGKIGFEDVRKVIENMTNEGGQFYNLMQEQSKTITGLISNLGDALDTMFNDIGKSQEGVISSVLKGTISLVENYQKVLDILIPLVAAYGAYKAALIVTAALQKAAVTASSIKAFFDLAKGINTAKDAQLLFNMAVKANPWGIALSLLTAIGFAAYRYTKNMDSAAKATSVYNKYITEEKSALNETFQAIKKAEKGTKDHKDAIDKINTRYGEYLSNMVSEVSTANDIALAYKEISKAINNTALAKAKVKFLEEPTKDLQKAEKYFWTELGDFTKELSPTAQGLFTKEIEQLINRARQGDTKPSQYDADKFVQAFKRTWKLDNPTQIISDIDISDILGGWDIGQVTTGYQQIVRAANDLKQAEADFADFSKAYITSDNNIIEEQTKETITATNNLKTAQETYDNAIKAWKKAIKEGADISVVKKEKESVDSAQKTLDEAKKLAGVDDKTLKTTTDAQKKLNEQIIANDQALLESRISIMKDGKAKELAEIDARTKAKLDAIDKERKEEEDRAKKAGVKLSPEREAIFTEREHNAQKQGDNDRIAVELKYAKDLDKIYKQITDYALSGEDRRIQGIKEKYQEFREWVESALKGGTLSLEESFKIHWDIDMAEAAETEKEAAEAWDDYYEKYGTFREKLQATKEKYDRKMTEAKTEGEKASIQAEANEALTALEVQASEWAQSLIGKTTDKLEEMLSDAQKRLKEAEDTFNNLDSSSSPEAQKYLATINRLRAEIARLNEQIRETDQKAKDNNWAETASGLEAIASGARAAAEGLRGLDAGLADTLGAFVNVASGAAQFANSIAAIGTKASFGNILAGVSAGIGLVSTLIGLFSQGESSWERNLRLAREFNEELRIMNERARINSDAFDSIFGKDEFANYASNLNVLKDAYEAYQDTLEKVKSRSSLPTGLFTGIATIGSVEKTWESASDSIRNMQVQTRHSTWFRSAKYQSLGSLVPNLFDKETGEIQMEALKKFVDDAGSTFKHMTRENQDMLKEMVENWDTYQQALDAVNEYLSGIFSEMGNNLRDALVDSWEKGTDAAEAFGDVAGDVLKKLAKDVLFTATIGPAIDAATKRIEEINANTSLSNEERFNALADVVDQMLDDVISEQDTGKQLWDRLRQAAEEKGLEWEEENSGQSATSRGFQAMSQDTGNELNGRFTDMQGKMNILVSGMDMLRSINMDTKNATIDMRDIMIQLNGNVADIRAFTKVLPTMNSTLNSMNRKLDNL